MKIIKYLVLSLSIGAAFADAALPNKNNAAMQIESAFAVNSKTLTIESAPNIVTWPTGLDVTIDNQWQLNLKSKKPINISRITIAIDDTAMANQVNLDIKPSIIGHYFFSDVKLQQIVQLMSKGFSFIGVYKQISADDFAGFTGYRYKKLTLTITWSDASKVYNQSVTNFMLVMAK